MSDQTKKPISEARLAANRANAQKSTGPKTPAGKLRSAANACRHGFAGNNFAAIRLENPARRQPRTPLHPLRAEPLRLPPPEQTNRTQSAVTERTQPIRATN
jgi:hypothetical protein